MAISLGYTLFSDKPLNELHPQFVREVGEHNSNFTTGFMVAIWNELWGVTSLQAGAPQSSDGELRWDMDKSWQILTTSLFSRTLESWLVREFILKWP